MILTTITQGGTNCGNIRAVDDFQPLFSVGAKLILRFATLNTAKGPRT